MGWDPALVEPPTKRYKPIVDYVSLTTFAFEAAMRWCRKSGMLAECQRSYHGEYFLPNATFNGIFAEKAAPISKWSKTFLPPNQKLPSSDHCLRFAKKWIMQCAVLVKVYYIRFSIKMYPFAESSRLKNVTATLKKQLRNNENKSNFYYLSHSLTLLPFYEKQHNARFLHKAQGQRGYYLGELVHKSERFYDLFHNLSCYMSLNWNFFHPSTFKMTFQIKDSLWYFVLNFQSAM